MKVGDLVKVRLLKGDVTGIIQAIQTRRQASGPNGDFFTTRRYRVLLNGKIWRLHEASLILISSCDIS